MCLFRCRNIRDLDRKTRRIFACGNVCLATSLVLTNFGDGVGHRSPILFSVLRGFLLGMAIVFLLWSSRRMRRFDSRA